MSKPRVLIFVDYYLPGFKAGGPIASVSRMVKNLRDEFDICIFTRDRDLGDSKPYVGIAPDDWNDLGGIPVYYAGPNQMNAQAIEVVVESAKPDLVYLNSYFSVLSRSVLFLSKRGRLGKSKVALAPRGEFSLGALALKQAKKRAYLKVARLTKLTSNVVWHVSSEHEREDVLRAAGRDCKTIIEAPDLISLGVDFGTPRLVKEPGSANFVWLSRISPKKNLIGAIEMLGEIHRDATLTIYGPIEDKVYWDRCQDAIKALPKNVTVKHVGGVRPDEVVTSLGQHHFFLFPTFGENFGHVIPEALSAGCPVLLSDQTPWLDLNGRLAGWVMPLDDALAWRECIQTCVDMDDDRYQKMRQASKVYVDEYSQSQVSHGNAHLFDVALAS